MKIDVHKVADAMQQVAIEVVMPLWRCIEPHQIKRKTSATDIVTQADLIAEENLSKILLDMLPGSHILGEEGYASDPRIVDALAGDEWVWIVDPVDGTLTFTKGLPDFGMIISLVKNNEIYAGWIYHPVTEHMLMAERGSGASFCGERLKVLPSVPLDEMHGILGMDILPHRSEFQLRNNAPDFDRDNYICCGAPIALLSNASFFDSSARIQKHFRATKRQSLPWDDAAGALAIREAGGEVINWQGELYRPDMFFEGIIAAPTLDDCQSLRKWLTEAISIAA